MAVRHPYFSIGEGTFREKEERIKRQGLDKKNNVKENTEQPLKFLIINGDNVWTPSQMPTINKVGAITFKENIKKKIWG